MPTRLDENNTCTAQGDGGGGDMPTRLDENNTCTVQGNGGGGGYAHTPRRE